MKCSFYTVHTSVPRRLKIAVCSDLHDNPPERAIELLKEQKPDLIALPGDICEAPEITGEHGFTFMRACAGIAPTFYSLGNHDKAYDDAPGIVAKIREMGVILLDDDDIFCKGIWIGGITSGFRGHQHEGYFADTPAPNLSWLDHTFCHRKGFKLLLCHHPEYYPTYLRKRDISLVLSGHAHGGQWRLFGRGVLAPGQGLFPKYTSGVHENKLVISRGMGDHTWIPRIFNPHEIVILELVPRGDSDENRKD